MELKVSAALVWVMFLGLPASLISSGPARSQEAPIKLHAAPLLAALSDKKMDSPPRRFHADRCRADGLVGRAIRGCAGPGPDVLTLSAPDGVKGDSQQYMFTVVFSRDGTKLGEAVKSCALDKLTDCTDQMVLDIKSAAKH